jgi:hypothetical protein
MPWPKPWKGSKDVRCDPPRVPHKVTEVVPPDEHYDPDAEWYECRNCSLTWKVPARVAAKAEEYLQSL